MRAVCCLLDARTEDAMATLDLGQLLPAYVALDTLCQQYLHGAVNTLRESKVHLWHHKLLYAWCAKQQQPAAVGMIAPADVREAHADLWAEVQLSERCGPRFADALSGAVDVHVLRSRRRLQPAGP